MAVGLRLRSQVPYDFFPLRFAELNELLEVRLVTDDRQRLDDFRIVQLVVGLGEAGYDILEHYFFFLDFLWA